MFEHNIYMSVPCLGLEEAVTSLKANIKIWHIVEAPVLVSGSIAICKIVTELNDFIGKKIILHCLHIGYTDLSSNVVTKFFQMKTGRDLFSYNRIRFTLTANPDISNN